MMLVLAEDELERITENWDEARRRAVERGRGEPTRFPHPVEIFRAVQADAVAVEIVGLGRLSSGHYGSVTLSSVVRNTGRGRSRRIASGVTVQE